MAVTAPWLACVSCEATHALAERFRCPDCGGELNVTYDTAGLRRAGTFAAQWRLPGGLWTRFPTLLPQSDASRIVSLGEGNTPLVDAPRLAAALGLRRVLLKLESTNPTGSFKDRQLSIALSKAREWGRERFATVSSGNVGVALGAYTAAAGHSALVWVPEDTAAAKRQQIQVYGARLCLIDRHVSPGRKRGFFTDLPAYCAERGIVPMISARPVNPFMVEGSKTIAFEVAAALGALPGRVFGPVGGGGCLGGLWKGFTELQAVGVTDALPRLHGVQHGEDMMPVDRLDDPTLDEDRYYRPLDGAWAWASIQASGGELDRVTWAEVRQAQTVLATWSGVFAEPQGASAFAGFLRAARAGTLPSDEDIVVLVTGTGLKDMQAAAEICAMLPGQAEPPVVAALAATPAALAADAGRPEPAVRPAGP